MWAWTLEPTLHRGARGAVRPGAARGATVDGVDQRALRRDGVRGCFSPFCLIARENGDADRICDYLTEYCRSIPNLTLVRMTSMARLSHVGYSKGTALQELTRMLGLTSEQVFCRGDHLNDLPMLQREVARWLMCPANAERRCATKSRRRAAKSAELRHGYAVRGGTRTGVEAGRLFQRPLTPCAALHEPTLTPALSRPTGEGAGGRVRDAGGLMAGERCQRNGSEEHENQTMPGGSGRTPSSGADMPPKARRPMPWTLPSSSPRIASASAQ